MIIRLGSLTDANALAALIQSFQPALTIDPTGAGAEEYLASVSEEAEARYLSSPRYAYLVAEDEGAIIGFIALRDNGHVYHMFVHSARQHEGIARALWNQAREAALLSGNPGAFTVNSSMVAVPVYRSFGFVPDGAAVQTHGIAFQPMHLKLRNDA
jgi:GNAT superfamily N-acetyltransferase